MAWEANVVRIPSMVAAADLTAGQYHFVAASADNTVNLSGNDRVLGVLYNDPDTGEAAEVATGGVVRVLAGEDITAGAHVGPNVGSTAGIGGNTDNECGICVLGGDNGSIISIQLGSF